MTGHELVTLVDAHDASVGAVEKLEAHRRGLRHRAVSVIICNDRDQMLIQQRAPTKYHSAGLWANACCGHPRPQETAHAAAVRRLSEEMGFRCALRPLLTTAYCQLVGNGLTENEICHLMVGRYSGAITPDPLEVAGYRWISRRRLLDTVATEPWRFAVWFRIYIQRFTDRLFGQ